jgi:hypothetical protein
MTKLTHAYPANNNTGWAGGDEYGCTRPITEEEARELPLVKPFAELAKTYPGLK